MLLVCKECGEEKPVEDFPIINGYRRRKCRSCIARYNLEYQRTHRKEIYQRTKAKAISLVFGGYKKEEV
jgi:transposase-like protein